MTILYVVIGLLFFLLILMLIPLKIDLHFNNVWQLKIRYLIFSYNILPKKNNKNSKNEKNIKNKNSNLKNVFKLLKNIKNIFNIFFTSAKFIIPKLKINLISIFISIAEDNAFDTALKYGKVCGILYPIIKLILDENKPKDYKIKIVPNFDDNKSTLNVDLLFDITIFNLLICIFKVLIETIKYHIKIKTKKGVKT